MARRRALHSALEIDQDDRDDRRERLDEYGVEIEQETDWDIGDRSIYFRDPDTASIELHAEC